MSGSSIKSARQTRKHLQEPGLAVYCVPAEGATQILECEEGNERKDAETQRNKRKGEGPESVFSLLPLRLGDLAFNCFFRRGGICSLVLSSSFLTGLERDVDDGGDAEDHCFVLGI